MHISKNFFLRPDFGIMYMISDLLDQQACHNDVAVVLCINQTGTKYQVYTQPQIWNPSKMKLTYSTIPCKPTKEHGVR